MWNIFNDLHLNCIVDHYVLLSEHTTLILNLSITLYNFLSKITILSRA